ncbi:hypothetical protein Rhopal_005419-T1 [Rhodotorula paludigena]|uniref:Zn(2)-C6 fungal-type domain-containing protein n=1 Tax=Rhodotorula paludigena TaxID=86838 RepID=A0AAV5GT24_9BASI|nr:hypothetical protein Rhopal_005419-T1 [Rhodotorula paludigena]
MAEIFDPARPFCCPEHLDRHVTAKHRVAKDFVCPVCSKGFARKDILKRHQQGHEKQAAAAAEAAARGGDLLDRGYESQGSAAGPKKQKKRASAQSDITIDDGSGPIKIARVGRACCRCSKSKLRCDGVQPCERCRKAGIECSFDRPPKPPSRQGSVSMMVDDNKLGLTPSMESDGDTTSPENAFGLSLPTPPPMDTWNRVPGSASAMGGMSPYHIPLRSPGHHALPPTSFQFGPAPANYYSGGRPEPFNYRNTSPYHHPQPQQPAFPTLNLPHHGPSPLNPFASANALPQPPPQPAPTSAQWDNSAFGRQIGENTNENSNQLGFLDLFSSLGNDQEIDWTIIGAGFENPSSANALPAAFNNTTSGPALEMGLLAPGLGGNAAQPMSDMRNGGIPEEPSPASAAALVLAAAANGEDRALPPPRAVQAKAEEDEDTYGSPERPTFPFRNNSLVESDNAAVSLLQLASHTPRVSPEPGQPPSSSSSKLGTHASALPHPHARVFAPSSLNPGSASSAGEETPRSSHPSHQPGDPWPLSYRPTEPVEEILPTSARGTGYLSRATSPPPHHPHASLAHVPSVTETTRLRILYKVRELSAADPSLSERFVPRLELLELFLQLYFDKYHALFPLVHQPTWDPNTAPSFLVLAVASVGARYAWERVVGSSMHAHALLECARRMAQIMGDLDNTLLRTVAWQQTVLIVLQSGMVSGNKRDLERTQAFANMPVTFARRQGWLKEPQVDEQAEELLSLDERWKRWRDREEIRRLGFAAVFFDCVGTALWNMDSSSLYLDAANTPLPCHDALWDAPTASAWASLFRHSALPAAQPTLSHAVHLACSFQSLSSSASSTLNALSRDAFALSTVLIVLHALGWERVHARGVEKTFLTPGAAELAASGKGKKEDGLGAQPDEGVARDEVDPAQAALEAGLDFFQDRILLPPDMLARLEDPGAASGSMALLVHLTALTQRLPLRVLQPLARSATAPTQGTTLSALRSWALASHGAVARTTAFHAGQLLALSRGGVAPHAGATPLSDGPIEPFALFYGALALVAFVREGGVPPARGDGGDKGEVLALDVLRDRTDPVVTAWVHSGPLAAPAAGGSALSLRMLEHGKGSDGSSEDGRLDGPRAAEQILSVTAQRLRALRVWKVGDLLAGVLEQFAAVERRDGDERDFSEGRGWALVRSDSVAASAEGGDEPKARGGASSALGHSVVTAPTVDDVDDDEDVDDEEQDA